MGPRSGACLFDLSEGKNVVSAATRWYLEGYAGTGRELIRTPVRPLPFRIGRLPALELTLPSGSVSQQHAEIYRQGAGLWVRDLDSTNGTFLNRRRVSGPALLEDGDILHFADQEFRLVLRALPQDEPSSGTMQLSQVELPQRLIGSARQLRRLLDERAILCLYQPIVRLEDGEVIAHEALCRGVLAELPRAPSDLLVLAASVGLERELSRVFRRCAVDGSAELAGAGPIFYNTHPAELNDSRALLADVESLLESGGPHPLVIEIHEAAVSDLGAMRGLVNDLDARGVALAYDDFGAGQARLLELVEAPPAYLKFDIQLIRGLDHASDSRRRMVEALVRMVKSLGILSLAEGVESPAEAQAVREAGFDLAQGYHFGYPAPASETG